MVFKNDLFPPTDEILTPAPPVKFWSYPKAWWPRVNIPAYLDLACRPHQLIGPKSRVRRIRTPRHQLYKSQVRPTIFEPDLIRGKLDQLADRKPLRSTNPTKCPEKPMAKSSRLTIADPDQKRSISKPGKAVRESAKETQLGTVDDHGVTQDNAPIGKRTEPLAKLHQAANRQPLRSTISKKCPEKPLAKSSRLTIADTNSDLKRPIPKP